MSQRLVSDASFNAFSSPCCAVTLPGTTVSARTSSSGEFRASRIASASSVPGSVSMITFLAATPATAAWRIATEVEEPFTLARARGATHSGEAVANKIKTGTNVRRSDWKPRARELVRAARASCSASASWENGTASANASFTNTWANLCGTSGKGPPPRLNVVKAITDFDESQHETGRYEKISTVPVIRFVNGSHAIGVNHRCAVAASCSEAKRSRRQYRKYMGWRGVSSC